MEAAQQTVLVVDDEPTNIHALGSLLADDYKVLVANSGVKALRILEDDQRALPDLILLDIQMPEMDGYEVCRRLKDYPRTSMIPIIFVTARDSVHDEEHGLSLGAVDYIIKPFSPAIVRARVATQMRLKRQIGLLEKYALLDGLTGIPNRRHFDDLLEREIKRSVRDRAPLSIIMIDIDHFKSFNDCYGHRAGDQCLQKVVQALDSPLARPGDQICRYGGEEFVAVLPGTHEKGARTVAETMRAAVEALSITHEYSSAAPVVTVSLGTATLDPMGNADARGEKLLQQADEALYAAKKSGRNRICP
ncbi:MAG: diguanylate cyclase [Wenzhouxiangella sp.]